MHPREEREERWNKTRPSRCPPRRIHQKKVSRPRAFVTQKCSGSTILIATYNARFSFFHADLYSASKQNTLVSSLTEKCGEANFIFVRIFRGATLQTRSTTILYTRNGTNMEPNRVRTTGRQHAATLSLAVLWFSAPRHFYTPFSPFPKSTPGAKRARGRRSTPKYLNLSFYVLAQPPLSGKIL